MLRVKKPFVGHGFNMPNPGDLIDPPQKVAEHLVAIDVCEIYETKIMEPPAEVKKKAKPSASSRAAPAPRKKTRKSSKKSATKSSQ